MNVLWRLDECQNILDSYFEVLWNNLHIIDNHHSIVDESGCTGEAQTNFDFNLHAPVRITQEDSVCRRRVCVVCRSNKLKTTSGGMIQSRWKCPTCRVALCRGNRNCYALYHASVFKLPLDHAVLLSKAHQPAPKISHNLSYHGI